MDNIASVRRYFAAWTDRDADAILASLIEGGTYQDPSTVAPISGDAIRDYVDRLWSAFPDLTFQEESIGETGPNRVAAQWLMRGTNTGSIMGLPPTGKEVSLRGADFFTLRDGKIETVTGYFDQGELPRQIGLDVIVQPAQSGPFKFGISTSVQTGKTQEPGAFSITYLEARDETAVKSVREGSRAALADMLKMEGFIGAVTATIGLRMVTISAWDSPEASRLVMSQGAHAKVQKGMYDGSFAKHGFTSVWTKHRINPPLMRCDTCGKMSRDPDKDRICPCGAKLPDPAPFW
ncbi:MAG: ester cyclase [Mesorhizobium sp.]|jgi:steroid delta-isomerase-like uncharacterized protein